LGFARQTSREIPSIVRFFTSLSLSFFFPSRITKGKHKNSLFFKERTKKSFSAFSSRSTTFMQIIKISRHSFMLLSFAFSVPSTHMTQPEHYPESFETSAIESKPLQRNWQFPSKSPLVTPLALLWGNAEVKVEMMTNLQALIHFQAGPEARANCAHLYQT
jgi:hypothetical protein